MMHQHSPHKETSTFEFSQTLLSFASRYVNTIRAQVLLSLVIMSLWWELDRGGHPPSLNSR